MLCHHGVTTGNLITVILTVTNFKSFLQYTHVHISANSDCTAAANVCKSMFTLLQTAALPSCNERAL